MTILISNDDGGVHAPGIRVLAQHIQKFSEVFVMANDAPKKTGTCPRVTN